MQSETAANFAWYARCLMAQKYVGDAETFARSAGAPERVQRLLTRAVPASSTADSSDHNALVGEFSSSLRTTSAFARLIADNAFVRAPLETRLGLITSSPATGASVLEGQATPVSRVILETNFVLHRRKVAATVVMTDELVRNTTPNGQSLFSRELKNSVSAALDAALVEVLIDTDTASAASTGTSATNAWADLRAALLSINSHADARLYWLSSPSVAKRAASLADTAGGAAFVAMTPLGGELCGQPCIVTDGVADGSLVLVDASGVVADLDTITLRASREADVLLEANPNMNVTTPVPAQMVSLFQSNSAGLLCTCWFGVEKVRDGCTAEITSISWGSA